MTVKNCMAKSDDGGFIGRKCRKPFKPKTMKINANKYRAMMEAIFIRVSFLVRLRFLGDGAGLLEPKTRPARIKLCSIAVADVAKKVRLPGRVFEKGLIHFAVIKSRHRP